MSEQGFVFSNAQLQEIAADILAFARQKGASACAADVSESFGTSVNLRKGEVDTIEYNRDKGADITVYLGQQSGQASTSDFSREALDATVEAALSIARFTAADPCAGLADPQWLANSSIALDLHHPWRPEVESAIEIARSCEDAAFAFSPLIRNSEGASVASHENQFAAANSHGFAGGFASSRHSISCSVIASQDNNAAAGDDTMQREYWYDMRRNASELCPAETIGRIAAERAVKRLGAHQIPTCEVPVLFEAPVAGSLLGHFVSAVSGGALYRQSSFLLDCIGKQIFSPLIKIVECPHLARQFGCTPFDDDGVATHARDIVLGGIVQGYFLSCYSARKLGLHTTGNAGGAHRLEVQGGTDDFASLVRKLERGLVVTELLGQGINLITGDYSRGAAGYWVEKGAIQYAVEEITIAGNLGEMFRGIIAVGNDTLARSALQCGSILIERMTVAGH